MDSVNKRDGYSRLPFPGLVTMATLVTILVLTLAACGDVEEDEGGSGIDERPTVEVYGSDVDDGETDQESDATSDVPPLYEGSVTELEHDDRRVTLVAYGQQPAMQMDALMEGELALNGDCLGVSPRDSDEFVSVVWPQGFTPDFEDETPVLLDEDGEIVAREGDAISLGGGNSPDPDGEIAEIAPEDCVAESYWMSGSEVRLATEGKSDSATDDQMTEPEFQTEKEAKENDAQHYADAYDIDLDEALRRLELQERLGSEGHDLETGEPDRFGGLFWEHEPEYQLVVQMTDGDEETVREYIDDPELREVLQVRTVEYTYQELIEVQEEIMTLLHELGVQASGGISVQENRVEVYVSDATVVEDALESADEELPDQVTIVEDETPEMLDEG